VLLVDWNVAGRKTRVQEQAERVLGLEPDVVCLAPRRQALGHSALVAKLSVRR